MSATPPTGSRACARIELDGALLDTSFLISLAKPAERNHEAARRYYKACLDRQVPMYLSALVIAEFSIKQSILDLELRHFIVLPFNIDHAMKAGQLWGLVERASDDAKAAIKDDLKLIGQCACETGISHVLTGDERTLAKHLRRLHELGELSTLPIVLAAGFDEAWFDGGQHSLPRV